VNGKWWNMTTIAKSFRELNTCKMGRESALKIFEMTKSFPAEERCSLTDQIRRSSRAVNAMIAAAWVDDPFTIYHLPLTLN
jgi:23S rRNA-intervening sequence protein